MNAPDEVTRRILVVEDEPSIAAMCRAVLTGEGFEVDIASNGRTAQEMVEESEYHLCLVDILMPRMSGQEFYEWLRKRYPGTARMVIFTTGSVIDEEIVAFIKQSGRPFLPKPFTPEQLRAVVQEALKQTEER